METKTVTMHKNAWKLLDAGRSKDDFREVLKEVYADDINGLVSTNGRVLVKIAADQVYNLEALEVGSYVVISTSKPDKAGYMVISLQKSDNNYPDYKKVIPEAGPSSDARGLTIPATIKKDPLAMTRAVLDLYKHTGSGFSIEYVAMLGLYTDAWTVNKPGPDKAARFEASGNIVIVLPFKIN